MSDGSTVVTGTFVPSNTLDRFKANFAPFVLGANLGLDWALSVSPATLRWAAEHATTNEQLQKHGRTNAESFAEGFKDDGNIPVFGPCDDGPPERVEFFKAARERFFGFKGFADTDDIDVLRVDVEIGSYPLVDVPVAAFRSFEDGWAAAVRERYKFVSV